MITIPKFYIDATNGYTQILMKIALAVLNDIQNGWNSGKIFRHYLQFYLGEKANISDIINKTVTLHKKYRTYDDSANSVFFSIHKEYPSSISFIFNDDIEEKLKTFKDTDTETIDFDKSIISALPNTGCSLKLLLLLLFAIKENRTEITTDEIALSVFGNKPAYTPNASPNATSNQLNKINNAIDTINAKTNFTVSVMPVKQHSRVISWKFSLIQPTNVKIADYKKIESLLTSSENDPIRLTPKEYISFILLFCPDNEAKKMIKDLINQAKTLFSTDEVEIDYIWKFMARHAMLYQHKAPKLWYTVPKVQLLLEYYLDTHPDSYLYDIPELIKNCKSYQELIDETVRIKFGE